MILVDTSALTKLLVEEAESESLRAALARLSDDGEQFAISTLATVELRRLAIRLDVSASLVEPVLHPFRVLKLTEAILQLAGRIAHRNLGTLDAIHLSTCLAAEATGLLTYDRTLADAAGAEGLAVYFPR